MEETICNDAIGNSSEGSHSPSQVIMMSFNGKRLIVDELDFFAEEKLSPDNHQMLHQMEEEHYVDVYIYMLMIISFYTICKFYFILNSLFGLFIFYF